MAEARDRRPITGSTRVAGVIGWPVRHSLSPTIMNAAFAATGLDWVYVAFEVSPDGGPAAVDAMRMLGLAGLSVTMPHKATVGASVDERTPVAAALEAVNCVFWAGDRLVGDNTDAAGFVDSLRVDHGVDPAGQRCAVVGAGGAGRAVSRALGDVGAAEVVVVNRSADRADRAAKLAGPVGRVGRAADLARVDLVVNATPIGMGETPALPFDPELIQPNQVLVDLIYHPLTTPLLAAATARGARSVSGLGMLVHQGVHAFRRWTGHEPPVAEMARAARAELEGRGRSGSPSVAKPSHGSTGIHPTMQPNGKDS
ncbi:MAG: shikimate dehydrogenase [Acidimicrobiales bacterium]